VRPRWLMHGHLHIDYQRRVDLGGGPLEIAGLDRDGAPRGNWAILDVASMRWLRVQGKPISNAIRGLTDRRKPGGQVTAVAADIVRTIVPGRTHRSGPAAGPEIAADAQPSPPQPPAGAAQPA